MAKFGKSASSSKSKKDNKGPKGKKARAKAKLEKQWGETIVYDHGRETTRHQQRQRGNSRRHSNDRQQHQSNDAIGGSSTSMGKTYNRRNDDIRGRYSNNGSGHGHEDDDDGSSNNNSENMNDDDEQEEEDNPLDGLLSMIRKTKKNKTKTSKTKFTVTNDEDKDGGDLGPPSHLGHDNMSDDDDGDDDSVSDSDDSDVSDVDADYSDRENDDDDVADIMMTDDRTNDQEDGHNSKKTVDIFRQRFSQQPLPDSVVDDEDYPAVPTTTTKKITLDRHSSSAVVELNVSIPQYRDGQVIGGRKGKATGNIVTSKKLSEQDKSNPNTSITEELVQESASIDWQDVAMSTFQSTNRSILRRRWTKQIGIKKGTQPSSIVPNGGTNSSDNIQDDQVDDVHASVYSFLARYSDMFVTTTSPSMSPNRQLKEQRSFHQMYLLHVLNHVLTSRGRIARNNRELKEKEEEEEDDESGEDNNVKEDKVTKDNDEDPDRHRDQGFTRPTVLVLLPTRGTCHRFVKDLYRLAGSSWNEDIKQRFETEYGPIKDEMDEDDDGDNDIRNAEKEKRRKAVLDKKGKEWNELFGDNANNDDDFKLGISLTPKVAKTSSSKNSSNVAVRVYTDFFKSDIIVASPLGLKMLILPDQTGDDDDDDIQDEDRERRKRNSTNYDFLSSIEICLIEHAETIMMQNWDHVNDVLDYLNQEPQSNNNADFSRVRNYLLNGQGQYWRQLILSSKFVDPTLNSFFKRFGKSLSGSIKVRRKIANEDAAVSNVLLPIKQVFQKVKSPSLAQQGQARVDFFINNILPQIERQKQTHTLVYIPSYFDFCAARNALLKRDVSFVSITEYSRTSEVGRGRARFLQGRKPIMLYTGRAHFFHRHTIKGVKHLIFLGVPEHSEFYSDNVNMIGSVLGDSKRAVVESDETAIIETSSCLSLFTKYEAHALERVVGSSSCTRMIGGTKTTFMFYT